MENLSRTRVASEDGEIVLELDDEDEDDKDEEVEDGF